MLKKNRFLLKLLTFAISALCIAAPSALAEAYIISDNLADVDITNINNSKLEHGSSSVPSDEWFNVGTTTAAGATSTQYIAPKGGIAAAEGGVKLTTARSGIAHSLFNGTQDKEGIYELKFSVKPNGSVVGVDAVGSLGLLYNQYTGSTQRRSVILNINANGEIFLPQSANPIYNTSPSWYSGSCDINDWLDVTAVYNLKENALYISVRQNGRVVAKQVKNIAGIGEDIKNNGLGYIRFNTNTVASGGPVIKNVTVKKLNDISEVKFGGFGEDFNYANSTKYDKTLLLKATASTKTQNTFYQGGWFVTSEADPSQAVDFSTDGNISVTSPVTQLGADIKPVWLSGIKGVTHYSYKIKASGTGTVRALVMENKIPATLEFAPSTGRVYANGRKDGDNGAYQQSTNSVLIGQYDPAKWVEVDEYMDITNKKWYVTVKQDGIVTAEGRELFVREALANNGVCTFRFDLTGSAPSVIADYVQIESVEAVPIPPELRAENIIITDRDGGRESLNGTVSPFAEEISLDFGLEMPEPSAREGITLSGGGGEIDFDLSKSISNGSVWIITPHTLLLPDTEYTLTVPQTVKNSNGISLEADCEIKFITGHAESKFSIVSARTDKGELKYIHPAYNGQTVTIETEMINMLTEDKSLAWYIAYYDKNNRFLSVDMAERTIPAQTMESTDMPKLSLRVPEGTAYAKLFLWDAKTLEPCGKPVVLENYDVFADFGESDIVEGMTIKPAINSELYNGRYGKRLSNSSENKNLYLKCNVDKNVMYELEDNTPIDIEVEYFDGEDGCFSIQYDSNRPDTGLYNGNTVMQQSEVVYLEGTNEWRTKVFHLEDMRMADRLDGDFRIAIYNYRGVGFSGSDIVFGSIKVKRSEHLSPVTVSFETDKTGNIFTDKDATIDIKEIVTNKSSDRVDINYITTVTNKITGEEAYRQSGTLDAEAGLTKPLSVSIPNNLKYSVYTLKTDISYYDGGGSLVTDSTESEFSVSMSVERDETDIDFGYQTQIISLSRGECSEVSELLSTGGITINRDGIPWDTVEKTKGILSLPAGVKDKLIKEKESGIDNILICSRYNSLYDNGLTPTSDEAIAAFANYCGFLARELKGIVPYFEIWNEYNHTPFNNNPEAGPENYAKMLEAAYKAIKAENPDALVIGMSTAGIDAAWQEEVYKAGGLSYCDIVSCHPYDWTNEFSPETLESSLKNLRTLIDKYGGNQPIWLTEIGFSTVDKGTVLPSHKNYIGYSQTEQASALVLSRGLVKQKGLADKYIGYCLYDRNNQKDIEACWGLLNYWGSDSGTKPRNGAKEAYLAAAAMNKLIGNAESIDYKQQKDGVLKPNYSYAFNFYNDKLGKNVLLVASSLRDKDMKITLGCGTVDIYDLYGNKINTLTSADGSYTFTAGTVPYYAVGSFTEFK